MCFASHHVTFASPPSNPRAPTARHQLLLSDRTKPSPLWPRWRQRRRLCCISLQSRQDPAPFDSLCWTWWRWSWMWSSHRTAHPGLSCTLLHRQRWVLSRGEAVFWAMCLPCSQNCIAQLHERIQHRDARALAHPLLLLSPSSYSPSFLFPPPSFFPLPPSSIPPSTPTNRSASASAWM